MHPYRLESGDLQYKNNWTNVGVKYGLANMSWKIILDSYILAQTPMILNKMRQKNFVVYRDKSQMPELHHIVYETNVHDGNCILMHAIRNYLERVKVRKSKKLFNKSGGKPLYSTASPVNPSRVMSVSDSSSEDCEIQFMEHRENKWTKMDNSSGLNSFV